MVAQLLANIEDKKTLINSISGAKVLVQVYETPKVGVTSDNEVKIRIIKRNNDILIHITAPDAVTLEKALQEIFPDEKDFIIEFCG